MTELTAIVLAAGEGTRMRTSTPKVLHEIGGRTLIAHVLHALERVKPTRVVVVVGHGREAVAAEVLRVCPEAIIAVQEEQLGTGHAVQAGLAAVPELASEPTGDVLVLYGDTPLLRPETLEWFAIRHRAAAMKLTVLTAEPSSPKGYGRIVRGTDGEVFAIVEEKDANDSERGVREVNSGIMCLEASWLVKALAKLGNDNAAREYYLTDLARIGHEYGHRTNTHLVEDATEVAGVNDLVQLAEAAAVLNRRTIERHLRAGVIVTDPVSTWIDAEVEIGPDTLIHPASYLRGDTKIGRSAEIGPFAHLRSGTVVGDHGKVGGFVETKNAVLGEGTKVPHLSYIGDAEVGAHSNLGAGTVTANYDGKKKHRTKIGSRVHGGSNVTYVAPVEVGDGVYTGAGAVIREDVPADSLVVSEGHRQRTIDGWATEKSDH